MRKLCLLILLFASLKVSAQWDNLGTTATQRSTTSTGYFFRNNLGSKGYVYWYTKGQIDSIALNRLPVGLRGQILSVSVNNSQIYTPVEPLVYGQFIYTDAQKARAFAAGSATQLQIFNSFKRFSHGGSQTDPQGQTQNDTIPGQPLQTNSWAYDTVANRVKSTFNSGSAIGFISPDKFDHYIHSATIGATTTSDNDRIGIVIAFYEDTTTLVRNNAYGLNPGDFSWPINTTNQFIPNQHSLALYINRETTTLSYFVVYDYRKLTQKIIANGSLSPGLYNTTASWANQSLDVKIERQGDTILINRSQYSDAPGGKGSLAFPLTVNLNSDTVLYKFKGKCPYGYTAQSQDNAYYSNISFSGSNNIVYDLRTGQEYLFGASGYELVADKNMYTDLGLRFYWRNKTESTFGYITPDATYDVIVGETP